MQLSPIRIRSGANQLSLLWWEYIVPFVVPENFWRWNVYKWPFQVPENNEDIINLHFRCLQTLIHPLLSCIIVIGQQGNTIYSTPQHFSFTSQFSFDLRIKIYNHAISMLYTYIHPSAIHLHTTIYAIQCTIKDLYIHLCHIDTSWTYERIYKAEYKAYKLLMLSFLL